MLQTPLYILAPPFLFRAVPQSYLSLSPQEVCQIKYNHQILGCVFFQSMIPFSKRSFVYFWNRRPRSPDEEDCFLVSNRQERFYPTLVATLSTSSWVIFVFITEQLYEKYRADIINPSFKKRSLGHILF